MTQYDLNYLKGMAKQLGVKIEYVVRTGIGTEEVVTEETIIDNLETYIINEAVLVSNMITGEKKLRVRGVWRNTIDAINEPFWKRQIIQMTTQE